MKLSTISINRLAFCISIVTAVIMPLYAADSSRRNLSPESVREFEERPDRVQEADRSLRISYDLLNAILETDLDAAQEAIKNGASVSEPPAHMLPPLIWAAQNATGPMISLLLDHGAPIDATDRYGNTALIMAAHCGNHDAVERLLQRGANTRYTNTNNDNNAAKSARKSGHDDIAEMIIRAGVERAQQAYAQAPRDPNNNDEEDDDGKAEDSAEESSSAASSTSPYLSQDEIPTSLDDEEYIDLESRDEDGRTPLILAVLNNNYDLTCKLLKLGANPNAPSKSTQKTPLFYAVTGFSDITKLLLQYGANPNITNDAGQTALMYAADGGDPDLVKTLLLDNDTEINVVDANGVSALTRAVHNEHLEVVKIFLEHGAQLHPEGQRWTPIGQACKKQNLELLKILFNHAIETGDQQAQKEIRELIGHRA